ncbi:MAG: hypothetical protein HC893_16560, partial [Chloroflexaceae bacterium]|nr:hypothetical protein [Chloroflexaceae bacterium]
MHTKLGLLLGIVLLLAACGGTPTTTPPQGEGSTTGDAATAITVRDPWVRAATMMNMGTQMDDHMGGTNHMTETEMGDMHSNMDSMDMDDGAGSNSA